MGWGERYFHNNEIEGNEFIGSDCVINDTFYEKKTFTGRIKQIKSLAKSLPKDWSDDF